MSEETPYNPDEVRSKRPLYMALVIMLFPALIPIYFALGAEEPQVVIFLVSLSAAVAISNILIIFALWRWVGRLQG